MKLIITENFWSVDRKGQKGYTDKVLQTKTLEVSSIGRLDFEAIGRRAFDVTKITANSIEINVLCQERVTATVIVSVGEISSHRPRSFDGGYHYRFELKKD